MSAAPRASSDTNTACAVQRNSTSHLHPLAYTVKELRRIRKGIVSYLSGYELAKLTRALGLTLTDVEKRKYMNPIRDLFPNLTNVERLI
jgi:hypothetical protein